MASSFPKSLMIHNLIQIKRFSMSEMHTNGLDDLRIAELWLSNQHPSGHQQVEMQVIEQACNFIMEHSWNSLGNC